MNASLTVTDSYPYPHYKPSGVEWLEEVPAHWDIRRVKYLLKECDTRSVDGSEELLRVSQYTGVTLRSPTGDGDEPDTRAASLVGYKRVEPDDLVVNIMLAWNGSMGVSQFRGITSPAYCVYRFRANSHPWYFHHLLRSPVYKARIKAVSTGVVESRLRLYTDDLYRLEALVPPFSEQTAIVRFLDHADRRIRRYIRAKQKLIALLEEQKQAIIHQAVTGQIDVRTGEPYPAYKDSGVKWLGDVPKHWEVRPFTRIAIEKADYRGATPTKKEAGVFLVTAKNIRKGWIDYEASREFVAEEEYPNIMRRGFPRQGDMLLTTEAPLGHAALVGREDIALAQRVIRFRLSSGILLSEFALHSVLDWYFQNQLMCRGTGSTALGIKASKLPQLKILCPPLNEQHTILGQIAKVQGRIDLERKAVARQVELLNEYSTRLIADVVTGKLDVREAAAELPEEDVPGDAEESAEEYTIEEEV